jgi:hypothetical protein
MVVGLQSPRRSSPFSNLNSNFFFRYNFSCHAILPFVSSCASARCNHWYRLSEPRQCKSSPWRIFESVRALMHLIWLDCFLIFPFFLWLEPQDGGGDYSTGASLKATFSRASLEAKRRFPKIPDDPKSYLTLRSHPNFFGCEEPETPLVIWIPNSPPLDGSRGITNSSINRVQVSLTVVKAHSEHRLTPLFHS